MIIVSILSNFKAEKGCTPLGVLEYIGQIHEVKYKSNNLGNHCMCNSGVFFSE